MAPTTNTKSGRPIQQQKPHMGFVSKATTPRVFFKPFDRVWTTRRLDRVLKPRSLMAAVGGYDHAAPGVPIRPTAAARVGLSNSYGYTASGCSSMLAAQASSMHSTNDVRHSDLKPLATNSSDNRWTVIPPSMPVRRPALTGRIALEIWNELHSDMGIRHSTHIDDLANRHKNADLLNKEAVWWLASIMERKTWNAIEVDYIDHRACIAELEDEITDLMRREQQSQSPSPFDINCASRAVRYVLEADVKALVEKQAKYDRERKAIHTFRKVSRLKREKFTWNSAANDPGQIKPREMESASDRVMQSCEGDESGEVPSENVGVKTEIIIPW